MSVYRPASRAVYFASDIVVQTSDNEGTPVALIEAQAADVPVVSTRVGGSASVVAAERLVSPGDLDRLARLVRELLADPERASAVGEAGGREVRDRFAVSRLVADLDGLYRRELGSVMPDIPA